MLGERRGVFRGPPDHSEEGRGPLGVFRGKQGTYRFFQEEAVPRQVVSAQQAPQDTNGALKEIDIHVFLEVQLLGNPLSGFFELCIRERKPRSFSQLLPCRKGKAGPGLCLPIPPTRREKPQALSRLSCSGREIIPQFEMLPLCLLYVGLSLPTGAPQRQPPPFTRAIFCGQTKAKRKEGSPLCLQPPLGSPGCGRKAEQTDRQGTDLPLSPRSTWCPARR